MRVNLFNRWHSNKNTNKNSNESTLRDENKKSKRKFPLVSSLFVCSFPSLVLFLLHFEAFAFDAKLVCCSWVRSPLVNFYFRFIQICNFVFHPLAIAILLWLLFGPIAGTQRTDSNYFWMRMRLIGNLQRRNEYRSRVWILSARRLQRFVQNISYQQQSFAPINAQFFLALIVRKKIHEHLQCHIRSMLWSENNLNSNRVDCTENISRQWQSCKSIDYVYVFLFYALEPALQWFFI